MSAAQRTARNTLAMEPLATPFSVAKASRAPTLPGCGGISTSTASNGGCVNDRRAGQRRTPATSGLRRKSFPRCPRPQYALRGPALGQGHPKPATSSRACNQRQHHPDDAAGHPGTRLKHLLRPTEGCVGNLRARMLSPPPRSTKNLPLLFPGEAMPGATRSHGEKANAGSGPSGR